MNLVVKCSVVLLISFSVSGIARSQSFVSSYPIYFANSNNTIGKLILSLWKCTPPNTFCIQVTNTSASPQKFTAVDCNAGQFGPQIGNDLENRVKDLIRTFQLLDLSSDIDVNKQRVEAIFNDKNFAEQLHTDCDSIRKSIAPPPATPATGKSVKKKAR